MPEARRAFTEEDVARLQELAKAHGWELPKEGLEAWVVETVKQGITMVPPSEFISILNWATNPVAHCKCNCC